MKVKKVLAVLIVVCLCVSMFSTVAYAAPNNAPAAPTATVEKLTGDDIPTNVALFAFDESGNLQPTYEKVDKLGAAFKFTADDVSQETYDYYKDWRCDYVVTFDEDIDAGTFGLYGKYGDYDIAFVYPDDIKAGDTINLVESAGLGRLTYEYIKNDVGEFTCGAFNLDGSNFDKTMTVDLAIWQDNAQDTTTVEVASNDYNFEDTATIIVPDVPTATVTELTGDDVPANVALFAYDDNGELQPTTDKVDKLGSAFKFTADEVSDDTYNYYKDWRCDYVVTFNEDIDAGTFGLYGKYGDYDIAFVYPDDIKAGDTINLVESAKLGRLTYDYIKNNVGEFTCGAFNLDGSNSGKNMDVKLVVWKDGEQETTTEILAEEDYDFADTATILHPDAPVAIVNKVDPVNDVPVYVMTDITNPDSITRTGAVTTINDVYTFDLNPDESAETSDYYKDWLCDFKVTFNEDIPANTFGLYGSYGDYNIAFVYPEEINSGDSLYLLDLLNLGDWTYENVKDLVQTFKCGAFNLSEVNQNVGKEMEVSLVMWAPGTDAEGEGTIKAAEETYDFGDLTQVYVTIAATAKDDNGSAVSATVTGGGDYNVGTEVTLTANAASGYDFVGWYLGEDQVSTDAAYTFTALTDAEYTAVYTPAGDGNLTIKADGFTIAFNGGAASAGIGTQNYNKAVGTTVDLTYSGTDFLYWVNSSNNIVSRDAAYSFVLVGSTELRAVSSGDVQEEPTAFVVFHNAYNQVIKQGRYDATDIDTQFPSIYPSKMGYTFSRWLIEDSGEEVSENDCSAIIDRMSDTDNVTINIIPDYDGIAEYYKVNVYIRSGGIRFLVKEIEEMIGETTVITKNMVASWSDHQYTPEAFSFFSLDYGETAISYGDQYTALSGVGGTEIDVTVVVNEVVTPEPIVAITQMFAAQSGTGYKVSSTLKYYVPDGYSIGEVGFVYSRLTDDPDKLTLDNVGNDGVKKHLSGCTDLSSIYTMNITTSYADRVFNVVAFVTYEDADNNIFTIYSPVSSGSYQTLAG